MIAKAYNSENCFCMSSADLRGPLRELRARLARLDDLFGTFAREPVPLDADGIDGYGVWQERLQALMQHVANVPVGKLRAALRGHVVHPAPDTADGTLEDLLRTRPYQSPDSSSSLDIGTASAQQEGGVQDDAGLGEVMSRRAGLLLHALASVANEETASGSDSGEEAVEDATRDVEPLQRTLRAFYCV